ncbi:MCE family protein [Pseudonocardiaceae bacterium YIM PH 21723]|nr:MCE family protein [Pseudonocardiaceae bacterium YIM PH 21723]
MKRVFFSTVSLLAVMVLSLAYLTVEVAQVDPTARTYRITVQLPAGGGLLDNSAVSYRGVQIGRVERIRLRPGGVAVTARLDADTQVPADTQAVVAALSAAGEQYLDFRPRSATGPYLADGAIVSEKDTAIPVPFAQLLSHVGGLADQIDPAKLDVITTELATATAGSGQKLGTIIDGGQFLLSGLHEVLPETVRSLHNGGQVLSTVAELDPQLRQIGGNGKAIGQQLAAADPAIRHLLDTAPGALDQFTELAITNKPTMLALLGNLATTGQMLAQRTATVDTLISSAARFGGSVPMVFRDGALYAVLELYPQRQCDYNVPHRPPTEVAATPLPMLDNHCTENRPDLQQRGSQNAPRPGGVTTNRTRSGPMDQLVQSLIN